MIFVDGAGLDLAGPTHDPGCLRAGRVAVGFGVREGHAVVAEEHDQRTILLTGILQRLEHLPHGLIAAVNGGEVLGEFLADTGQVGQEPGNENLPRRKHPAHWRPAGTGVSFAATTAAFLPTAGPASWP